MQGRLPVRDAMKRMCWRVKYVPRSIIGEYNACYRAVYRGSLIYPPAADRLGIPVNEVWVAEDLKPYEAYVLFHELREIEYRASRLGTEEAHLKARIDEALAFCGDQAWLQYFREYPDSTMLVECVEGVCHLIGESVRDPDALLAAAGSCRKQEG